jgi:hypothetical protein
LVAAKAALRKRTFKSVGRFSIRWAQKKLEFFSNVREPMTKPSDKQ